MKRVYIILLISLSGWSSIYAQDLVHPLLLTRSLLERGEYTQALESLRKSPEASLNYYSLLLKGEIFLQSGEIDSAIISFSEANLLRNASGYLWLARAYANMGDSYLSTKYLELHLKSDLREPLKDLLLDKNLQKIENSKEWRALWKKSWYTDLEEGVAEVEYIIERGGQIQDARELAKNFLSLYSDRAETDYIKGCLAIADGEYKTAAGHLERSLAKDNSKIEVWIAYINSLGNSGDYLSASVKAMDAIALFPDRLSLYLARIDWLRRAGDRELAVKEIEQILKYYPDREDLLSLAGKLALETRRYSKAMEYSSENIEKNPGNPDHYILRGDVYLATRTWEFAINDYSMALDLNPRDGNVYFSKGMALIETNKTADACHDFKAAMRLGNKKAAAMISRYCIK